MSAKKGKKKSDENKEPTVAEANTGATSTSSTNVTAAAEVTTSTTTESIANPTQTQAKMPPTIEKKLSVPSPEDVLAKVFTWKYTNQTNYKLNPISTFLITNFSLQTLLILTLLPIIFSILTNNILARQRHGSWMFTPPVSLTCHDTVVGRMLSRVCCTTSGFFGIFGLCVKLYRQMVRNIVKDKRVSFARLVEWSEWKEYCNKGMVEKEGVRLEYVQEDEDNEISQSQVSASESQSTTAVRNRKNDKNKKNKISESEIINTNNPPEDTLQNASNIIANTSTSSFRIFRPRYHPLFRFVLLLPIEILASLYSIYASAGFELLKYRIRIRQWTCMVLFHELLRNKKNLVNLTCLSLQISLFGLVFQSWFPVQENRLVESSGSPSASDKDGLRQQEIELTTYFHRVGTTPLFVGAYTHVALIWYMYWILAAPTQSYNPRFYLLCLGGITTMYLIGFTMLYWGPNPLQKLAYLVQVVVQYVLNNDGKTVEVDERFSVPNMIENLFGMIGITGPIGTSSSSSDGVSISQLLSNALNSKKVYLNLMGAGQYQSITWFVITGYLHGSCKWLNRENHGASDLGDGDELSTVSESKTKGK